MIPLALAPKRAEDLFEEIRKVIYDRVDFLLVNDGFHKGKGASRVKITLDRVTKDFLVKLKSGMLRDIVTSKPEDLLSFHSIFEDLCLNSTETQLPGNKRASVFEAVVYSVFVDYGYAGIAKGNFIMGFEIDTCPYCNRNYIYSFEKEQNGKLGTVKPQIDHFYPKDKYPILGSSFYNLIPSCLPCNGTEAKHNHDPREKGMKSPYEIKYDDFHFSVDIEGLDFSKEGLRTSFKLEMDKKVDGNARVFHLDEYYQLHKDHVAELILKSELEYSKAFRDSLSSIAGVRV